jgi:hypothetical protein
LEVVSTALENTVINGYFSKTTDLIAIWSCSLAGSGWSRFLLPVLGHGGCERLLKGSLLPANEITSENWGNGGFCSGFLWVFEYNLYIIRIAIIP